MERPLVEVTQGAKNMADGIWQCLGVFADHSQICFLYAGLYAARIEFHFNSMPPIELPRLTGSLRAFSGVSYPHSRPPENVNDLLKRKRQLRARKQLAKTLSWVELKNLISESASSDKVAAQEVCISLLTDKKKVFLSSLFSQPELDTEIVYSSDVLFLSAFPPPPGKDDWNPNLQIFVGAL